MRATDDAERQTEQDMHNKKTKTHESEQTAPKMDQDKDAVPNGSKSKGKEEELSEEDQQLKSDLEVLVDRLKESDTTLYQPALDQMINFIRTSTSSMTAVPKPLKFLGPYFTELKEIYAKWPESITKQAFANVLSLLAMTYGEEGKRESLHYRLAGPPEDPGLWGHEYVRHLAAEIGQEHRKDPTAVDQQPSDEIMTLVNLIIPFFLKHNAEADAVDLLSDLELIELLPPFIDINAYGKVCLYMVSCVNLLPPPEDVAFLRTAHAIYKKFDQLAQAMTLAIRLDDHQMIKEDFEAAGHDLSLKKQLGFMVARQQIWLDDEDETLAETLRNTRLSEYYKYLAKDLNIQEPKLPEDIYKTHLEHNRHNATSNADSAQNNLASSFVNAFVNAGFGRDKLVVTGDEKSSFIYRHKEGGKYSATAAIGMLLLWDVDLGLAELDKYVYADDESVKGGALLGIGILNSTIHSDMDPVKALLEEYTTCDSEELRLGAVSALGIAYAGSDREDIIELLTPTMMDTTGDLLVAAIAALSMGMVCAGSCNGDVTSIMLQTVMERAPEDLGDSRATFIANGLAYLYLGKQDASDATIETLKAIDHPLARYAEILVTACAYAGTGNVLEIQKMLLLCNEPEDKDEYHRGYHGLAVIGIALIAMGEEIGTEMALRLFGHLMHYGDPYIRKAVPLALGLLSASTAQLNVIDMLSRYSHDNDVAVAANAILAMGLVGAGTNNARLAQLLRGLSSYYSRERNCLFLVRVAQGLVHMGKGTLSLNPYHSDRQIMSKVAVCGLTTVLVSMTDAKSTILGPAHWLLFYLVSAMRPRFLITLDESLRPTEVTVRVGQAVDTVGQAGRPKTITGFQTHTSPVLISHGERAELATEQYKPISSVVEGLVVLKKNEEFVENMVT